MSSRAPWPALQIFFDKTYVEAVRLGEITGTLDLSLRDLADGNALLTLEQAIKAMGTSRQTIYPCWIVAI